MKTIRISSWLVAAALTLGVSTARADSLPVGMVNAKNVVERTVTIDEKVYQVNSSTRIVNKAGQRIQLAQLVTEADLGQRVDIDQVTYAYDASGGVLTLLEAVDARD